MVVAFRIIIALMIIFMTGDAFSYPIISGLSLDKLQVGSNSEKKTVTLFGACEKYKNLMILIKGQKRNFVLMRKDKYNGIWLNRDVVHLQSLNSFYSFISTGIEDRINDITKEGLGLSQNFNDIQLKYIRHIDKIRDISSIKQDFQNINREKSFYSDYKSQLDFVGNHFFRWNIDFPKDITLGLYTVEVYLFDDEGYIKGVQILPLAVESDGFNSLIINLAMNHEYIYVFLALTMSLTIGWFGTLIRKKV